MGILKKLTLGALLLLVFVSVGSQDIKAEPMKVEIKFTGGIVYSLFGDLNDWRSGETQWSEEYCTIRNYPMEGEWGNIHLGWDFEADFLFYIADKYGIYIGFGYLNYSKDKETITKDLPWTESSESLKTDINAIPLKLGVFFSLPISDRFSINLNMGTSYYFTKYENEVLYEMNNGIEDWNIYKESAQGNGLGFDGTIGFEYLISKNISFLLEGMGRYAKIGGFEGDVTIEYKSFPDTTNEDCKLYYYEWYSSSTDSWYPWVAVWDDPSGPYIRNTREAYIDLSGISLRAGIKIGF